MSWPDTTATHGRVEFDRDEATLVLPNPWCKVRNRTGLRGYGDFVYSNVALSDTPGEVPRRPTPGPLIRVLELILRGDVLHTGDPIDALTEVEVLEENLDHLQSFAAPMSTGDGALDSRLYLPSGALRVARAQLELTIPDAGIESTWGVLPLKVTVPTGAYVPEEIP